MRFGVSALGLKVQDSAFELWALGLRIFSIQVSSFRADDLHRVFTGA